MKNLLLSIFFITFGISTSFADSYSVTISGVSYQPDVLNVVVGDEITIQASGTHPLVQVTESTWNTNGNTQMPGGFGMETSSYTFTVSTPGTIYYVCSNHVGAGMKGLINVSTTTDVAEAATITSLKVFPNLVLDGKFSVTSKDKTLDGSKLDIYDIKGQKVMSFNLNGSATDLTTDLPFGSYNAVIVKNGKTIHRQRMIFAKE